MQQDIWRFIFVLSLAALVGYLQDQVLLCMLLASIGFIIWQFYQINRLYKWVNKPGKNSPPNIDGLIYLLHREISLLRFRNNKRKKRLSSYLKQFRKAASALPDAVILVNADNQIEWTNPAAKSLFGIQWPQDSKQRIGNLIRNPDFNTLLESDKKQGSIEIPSPIENNRFLTLKIVPYTDNSRLIVARDVSRLLKVTQMHKDFVANVSHELKTPLTVLRGYLEMLGDDKHLDKKFKKPVQNMLEQSNRMQSVVSDLLYLSRLEESDSAAHKQAVNVVDIISQIQNAAKVISEPKRQFIELNIDSDLQVLGNKTELHSAFSNLIFNAIHYTPDKGIINIIWYQDDDGAHFVVKDNGAGIPQNHLHRLTERFYRIDKDRSRDKGGTGLGLAIVKHVLNRHQANLHIESTPGVGSTFRCDFPKDIIIKASKTA